MSLFLVCLWLAACTSDDAAEVAPSAEDTTEVMLVIDANAPETRATVNYDKEIRTIRIYAYPHGTAGTAVSPIGYYYQEVEGNGPYYCTMDLPLVETTVVDFLVTLNDGSMSGKDTSVALNENTTRNEVENYMFTANTFKTDADGYFACPMSNLLEEGKSVAIVSDAGYPLISDPGAQLVSEVIDAGYPAVPISGSSAALDALVASGLSPQPFLFYGFLDSGEKQRIRQLLSLKEYPMTLIFYEAPHRIAKMLQNCLDVLGDREMCLARELTKKHEEFIRGRISEVLDMCDSLKGEMVVVMAGYQEEKEPDLTQAMPLIKEHIRRCINEGMTTNEAIRKVAREHGLSKNEVYRQYHGLN